MIQRRAAKIGARFILLVFLSLSGFAFSSGKKVILVLPPNHELEVIHLKEDAARGDPSGSDGRVNAWIAADSGGSAGQTSAGHYSQGNVYDAGNSEGSAAKSNRRPAWSRPISSASVEGSNAIFDGGSSFGVTPVKSYTRNPAQESNVVLPRGKWSAKLRGEEEGYNQNEGNGGNDETGPLSWSTLVTYPNKKPSGTSSLRGPNRGPFYGSTSSWSGDTFNNVDLNKGISNIKLSNNGWKNQNSNDFRSGKNGWSNTGNNNLNLEEQGWKIQENNALQTNNNGWKNDGGNGRWKSANGKNLYKENNFQFGNSGWKGISLKSANNGWNNPGINSVKSYKNGQSAGKYLQSDGTNKWRDQGGSDIHPSTNRWKEQESGSFNSGWENQGTNNVQSSNNGWKVSNNLQSENNKWISQDESSVDPANNGWKSQSSGKFNPLDNGWKNQETSSVQTADNAWNTVNNQQLENSRWKNQGTDSLLSSNYDGKINNNLQADNNGYENQGGSSFTSGNSGWSNSDLKQGNNGWKDQGVSSLSTDNSGWSNSDFKSGNKGWTNQGGSSFNSGNNGWSSQSITDLKSETNAWDNRETTNIQHGWENQADNNIPTTPTNTELKYKDNSNFQSTSDGWVPNQLQPSKSGWVANDQDVGRPSVEGLGFQMNNGLEKYWQSRNKGNNLSGKYSSFRTQDKTQGNGWIPMGGNYLQGDDKYRANLGGSKTTPDEIFQDSGWDGRNLGDARSLSNTVWQSIEGNKLTKGGYRIPLRDGHPEGQTFETGGSFRGGQPGQIGWTAIKESESFLRDDKEGCSEEYGSKCQIVKVIHVVSSAPQDSSYEKTPEDDRGWSSLIRPSDHNESGWNSSWKIPGVSTPTSYSGSDYVVKATNTGDSGVMSGGVDHGPKESLTGSSSSSVAGIDGGGDRRNVPSEDADIYIGVNSYGLKVNHGKSKFYHKGYKGNVGVEKHSGNANSYSSVTFGESKRPIDGNDDANDRKFFKRKVSSSKTSPKRILRGADSNLRAAVALRSTPKK